MQIKFLPENERPVEKALSLGVDKLSNPCLLYTSSEQSTEGTVEDGDTLNIDYEGKVDGKTFDGGSAEGASLTIGTGTFIDGFESGLVGKKIGSTVTVSYTHLRIVREKDMTVIIITHKLNEVMRCV